MGALQMKSTRAKVANLQCGLLIQTLLHRCAPLLNVLRRWVWIEPRKAHHSLAQHSRSKIKPVDRRNKVIALIGLWEDVWNIVPLIAPRVHVDRRVEDTVCGMQDDSQSRHTVGNAETRREVQFVGVHQTLGITVLPSNKDEWLIVLKDEVRVRESRVP